MRVAAGAAAAALAVVVFSVPSETQARAGRDRAETGHVTAESMFGHGSITAPVRRGRTGWEVRMPHGTWIDCGRSCVVTLRQQTIDYWESNGRDAPGSGPNYFTLKFGWW